MILLINEYLRIKSSLYHTATAHTIENGKILSIDPSPLWLYSVRLIVNDGFLALLHFKALLRLNTNDLFQHHLFAY